MGFMSFLMLLRFLPILLVIVTMDTRMFAADLTSHPMVGQGPIEVKVQVALLDLDKISGAEQNYTANLAYAARWSDPRLRHEGPGEIIKSLGDIWHPRLQIVNRQRLQETFPDEARVSPEGDVITVQRIWGDLSQPLALRDFPFDQQELRVDLVATGHEEGSVVLMADPDNPSLVSDRLAISDWELTGWTAEPVTWDLEGGGKSLPVFRLAVSVERNFRYHLVNFILPLVMIICMSWVVFWINPKNANPRISVSVTAMLTLIAYRFAVSASLPKIGYLTRMDWFILGSSVLVFASLLEVVTTGWLAENGRIETACRVNRGMRFIAPVVFAIIAFASLA
jgi:hypothetical protein